jgi:NTE family protein
MSSNKKGAPRGGSKPKTINLALQGGGAHGAFTWGVLDRLLADDRLVIDGISATRAARQALEEFWRRVSLMAAASPVQQSWFDRLFGGYGMDFSPSYQFFDFMTRLLSPYQFNPSDINPLRELLVDSVDFDRLRAGGGVKLFVAATNVRTGKIKVFESRELSAGVLLASACLPLMFRAVEVDGQHYWDGGYMGNPAIFPLIYGCDARDVVIVHINPIEREELPTTARDILNRMDEISFNSSLMREMRAIQFVTDLIDREQVKDGRLKRMLIHSIEAQDVMAGLGVSSKLNPDWEFLTHLRDVGRERADRWLDLNYGRLGRESTVDLRDSFL